MAGSKLRLLPNSFNPDAATESLYKSCSLHLNTLQMFILIALLPTTNIDANPKLSRDVARWLGLKRNNITQELRGLLEGGLVAHQEIEELVDIKVHHLGKPLELTSTGSKAAQRAQVYLEHVSRAGITC